MTTAVRYQPRWIAYAKSLGKTPEELGGGPVVNAAFMAWISQQWGAWAKATGRDRHIHTQDDHASFDAFIGAGESA